MNINESERRLSQLLADPDRLFILWMIQTGQCRTLE